MQTLARINNLEHRLLDVNIGSRQSSQVATKSCRFMAPRIMGRSLKRDGLRFRAYRG